MSRQGLQLYTADTVAVLGYLADDLPTKIDAIFKKAENGEATIAIPCIVIGECLFTLLRGREVFGARIPVEKLSLFLDYLEGSPPLKLYQLGAEGWRKVMKIPLPELHDRMVVAIHLLANSEAILTDDREIAGLTDIAVLWG